MKTIGIAIYHSNVRQYPRSWITQCLQSLYKQAALSGWEYILYELNYGQEPGQLSEFSIYRHVTQSNYAAAMNFIYQWIFKKCDAVANVNIDDWYAEDRLVLQLPFLNEYDIVSCNYFVTNEFGEVVRATDFAEMDVAAELMKGNNIVSNPGHIMKKEVFEKIKFDPRLVPAEDLRYWQDCIRAGFKIKILPECLHYRREHPMQEGNKK